MRSEEVPWRCSSSSGDRHDSIVISNESDSCENHLSLSGLNGRHVDTADDLTRFWKTTSDAQDDDALLSRRRLQSTATLRSDWVDAEDDIELPQGRRGPWWRHVVAAPWSQQWLSQDNWTERSCEAHARTRSSGRPLDYETVSVHSVSNDAT